MFIWLDFVRLDLAVKNILQEYPHWLQVLKDAPERIAAAHEHMAGPMTVALTGMPGAHDPKAVDARLATGVDQVTALRDKYAKAKAFVDGFAEGWGLLSADEQLVLTEFFMRGGSRDGAEARLVEQLNCGRSQIYSLRTQALRVLEAWLYMKLRDHMMAEGAMSGY